MLKILKTNEIHIRDPFIVVKDGKYYMFGTRGNNFGQITSGFDVYVGDDLENWSPINIFDSEKFGLNKGANWAPEVHEYNGKFYMLATFEQENGMRGTYSLVSDAPDKEFTLCSEKALTPHDWWSLDGTLYVSPENKPYLVFCHEHVQILNGTVCYIPLNDDLSAPAGEPVCIFSGSDAYGVEKIDGNRYVTDGPFIYRGKNSRLYMIWSTSVNGQYYQCIAVSDNGDITGNWTQLRPIFTKDGGHGMVFVDLQANLRLTLHCPNEQPNERPAFFDLNDNGETLEIVI